MKPRGRALWVAAAIASATLACSILTGDEKELGFDHRLHYEDEGLDCSMCHVGAESSDEPGLPRLAQCALCHDEDTEAEKEPERRIDQLFEGASYKASGVSKLSDEPLFSHLAHVEYGVDCSSCHEGIEQSRHPSDLKPIKMSDCMSCHTDSAVANDCSTCHSEIDENWQPPSHFHNWTRVHGPESRSLDDTIASRCDLCHKESSCNDCHFKTKPESHNNYWRLRGHGVVSRMERTSCAACHRTDFCNRCHESTQPLSHRGGMFGSTQNTHCLSCHFPLRANGCVTCHKATPGHLKANPRPPGHTSSSNCRGCHGVTERLPHADNGALCIICHS